MIEVDMIEIKNRVTNLRNSNENIISKLFENVSSFDIEARIQAYKKLREYMIKNHEDIRELVLSGLIDVAKVGLKSTSMIIRYESMSLIQNIVFASNEFYQELRLSGTLSYVKKYTKLKEQLPNLYSSAMYIITTVESNQQTPVKI